MIVRWTEAALSDLAAIQAHISLNSERYALAMVERIFAKSELLQTFPSIGWVVEKYDDDTIREVLEASYRIIYRVIDSNSRVDVLAVIHGAKRLPRRL